MTWGIRKKLIIFLILVTVVPFGTAIGITYYQTTKSLNQSFVTTNYEVLVKGKESLTSYLNDVAQMSTVLYRYTPFMNVLRDGVDQDINTNQEEVRRALAYLFNSRPEIEQMHLYIDKGKDSYTNYHSRISGRGKYEYVFSHPYYARLNRSSNTEFSIIEPPHEIYSYNNISVIPNGEKMNVLSFHNIIRDVPSDKFLGFLSIDVNLSRISGIAGRLFTKEIEDVYVMDKKGTIIYSSNEKEIGKQNNQAWYKQVKKEQPTSINLEWKDPKFSGVIVYERFDAPYDGWYIVKRIPFNVLYQGARQTALTNILIGVVSVIIVLFATLFISLKITAPIKVLIANMKRVEKGEFKADFDSLGNDEIGMLGRHFKLMIEKINELIEREYKLDIQNKSSQLRVLRSQINPHFLYNALQSIGTLALKHQAVPVYKLLTSLSTIMRYSMNMKEDVVPFYSELRHVQSYLMLQKQRFEEQLEVELDIQPEVEDIPIPKMILQPIIENSFKHGFDQSEGELAVGIKAYLNESDNLIIVVRDNGGGINQEELIKLRQEVFHGKTKGEKSREAIGLKNIYDRLQIYYQNQARMDFEQNEQGGFSVIIELPKVMPKEVEQE